MNQLSVVLLLKCKVFLQIVYCLYFYSLMGSILTDCVFTLQGARMVRELFEMARSKKACIIFFDEIDAVGGNSWYIICTNFYSHISYIGAICFLQNFHLQVVIEWKWFRCKNWLQLF